ncbi:MAG: hypothetical protein D6767_10565, partial [Candidatus Hydrogenedentota bacterium]
PLSLTFFCKKGEGQRFSAFRQEPLVSLEAWREHPCPAKPERKKSAKPLFALIFLENSEQSPKFSAENGGTSLYRKG